MVKMWALATILALIAVPAQVAAAVLPRQDPTPVATASATAEFAPLAAFAAAAYCQPSQILDLSCGATCDALGSFVPTAAGGDGDSVQFWFVGFDPALQSVVVAHQGTDPSELLPLLTDADFFLEEFDTTLFPGLSSSIKAHSGFLDAQSKTASEVLAAVQKTMASHSTTHVTLASHSLGAAISLLDAVFLQLHLPTSTSFTISNFGQPRIGNQEFADYVDAHLPGLTHMSNKKDPVPILPGRFLGFVHPSGELHIQKSGNIVACAGQDDTVSGCTISDVPNILESDLDNHDGPYLGVEMGDCS